MEIDYKKRNEEMYKLHLAGFTYDQISKQYSIHITQVYEIVRKLKNRQFLNPEYFNVDELDCWIIPSTDDRVKRY
jgi:Mor family transcriptional regulator